MTKDYDTYWKDWIVYTIRMPPSLKTQLENKALRRRTHQSTIVREALEIYFRDHCDSEAEQKAAEIMTRRREESLKLEGPKDKYDSLLFPVRVRKFVNKMRGEWKNADYPMSARLFDELIAFVEEEKEVIAGNPKEETIYEMLDQLISELEEERDREFPEEV